MTGETIVVIGAHYWGKGEDLATAKRNFRQAGGTLKQGYVILTFDAETEFLGINDMGYYSWRGNAPTEQRVEPKG